MLWRKAEIIPFPKLKQRKRKTCVTRKRVFYLGYHEYTVNPLYAWRTDYWVKRIRKGERWELYCTDPENTGNQRILFGEFSPQDIRRYFEDVGFEVTDDDWHSMGWRDFSGANFIDFEAYYWERHPDKFCAICRDMLPHDPFETHSCE